MTISERVAELRAATRFLSLEEDDWYFNGDLEAGKIVARNDRFEHVEKTVVGTFFYIFLCSHDPEVYWADEAGEHCRDLFQAAEEIAMETGRGDTEEIAWRYALGEMFGPVDEGYDHEYLRRLLISAIDPLPDDPEEVETWLTR